MTFIVFFILRKNYIHHFCDYYDLNGSNLELEGKESEMTGEEFHNLEAGTFD
jgi:hypothetical protein